MAMQKTVAGGKGSQFPLYRVWDSMKYRCNNPRSTRWKYYGGRGIKVCEEWMASYEKFAEWATANGYAQGLEIDRRNNDGDYSPENCRWVTRQINTRNKRKPSNGRTSKYLGVSRCGNRWRAQIGGDARGKSHIGLFKSEVDAAKAFDAEVVRRFGTGVATNFMTSTTGDAMTLREIQVEVGEWSQRNFGDQVSKVTGQVLGSLAPLMGIAEELGEFFAAMTTAEMDDAQADIGIYLLDFLHREGVSVDDLPAGVESPITQPIRWLFHAVLKRHQGIRGFNEDAKYDMFRNQACADILAELRGNPRFDAVLEATWLKVKQRDWEKNRANAAEVVG